jgi:hypothetical protein
MESPIVSTDPCDVSFFMLDKCSSLLGFIISDGSIRARVPWSRSNLPYNAERARAWTFGLGMGSELCGVATRDPIYSRSNDTCFTTRFFPFMK